MSKRTLPKVSATLPTEEQIEAFKASLQAECRGIEAKTAARICASMAKEIEGAIIENDVHKFIGNIVNASDFFWESHILSMTGVDGAECKRRMKAARAMMLTGKSE